MVDAMAWPKECGGKRRRSKAENVAQIVSTVLHRAVHSLLFVWIVGSSRRPLSEGIKRQKKMDSIEVHKYAVHR